MRTGDKSDLSHGLEELIEIRGEPDTCDTIIVDGPAIIHALRPKGQTLKSYAEQQLTPLFLNLAAKLHGSRLDVSWDLYFPDSIKASTRESRGSGVRRKDLPLKGNEVTDFDCAAIFALQYRHDYI